MSTSRPRRPPVSHQQSTGRQPPRLPPSSASATRTRLIRFRLNPRSSQDQQILTWLQEFAPYYRADAIRTALFTHILRRSASRESLAAPAPSSIPTAPPSNGVLSIAAQKLEKLFSS
jgi:hypothetical protein